MKREALRLDRVTLLEEDSPLLDHLSLHIFEGEIFGLVCLNAHGKQALLRLLEQNIPLHYGFVYMREKQVNTYEKSDYSYNKVAYIGHSTGLIDNLTVAENIFVVRRGYQKWMVNRRVLDRQVRRISEETGILLAPDRYVRELSFYDRFVTAAMKAYITGVRLVVVENLGHYLNPSDLRAFHRVMRTLAAKGMSFLYLRNRHDELFSCCDRAAIMEDGRILGVLDRSRMNEKTMRSYAEPLFRRRVREGRQPSLSDEGQKCLLSLRRVACERVRDLSFDLKEGESLVLQDGDGWVIRDIMKLLSGRAAPQAGEVLFDRAPLEDELRRPGRIAFIDENPAESMIFPGLSVLDNLCFTADRKLPSIWRSARIRKSVQREYAYLLDKADFARDIMSLPVRARLDIVYHRVLLQRPRLVVCAQPFAQTDLYLRAHILDLFQRIRSENIAMLILTVNLPDALAVADRLLLSERGCIKGAFSKSEFDAALAGEGWRDRTGESG